MSSFCLAGSMQEHRLRQEGKQQERRLQLAAKKYGCRLIGPDSFIQKQNFELGCDVVGLAAVRIDTGATTASLVTAPGCYFGNKDLKPKLLELVSAVRSDDQRVLLVYKKSLNRHAPPLDPKWRSRARRRRSSRPFSERRTAFGSGGNPPAAPRRHISGPGE